MGAWGPGLYSDDTTCEIRDTYKALLESGKSSTDAIAELLGRYNSLLQDPEIETLVYLALAETLWRYGQLTPKIQQRALDIIRRGADLGAWRRDSPKYAPTREKAITTLQKRLLSAQPAPRLIHVKKQR